MCWTDECTNKQRLLSFTNDNVSCVRLVMQQKVKRCVAISEVDPEENHGDTYTGGSITPHQYFLMC